MPDLILDAQYEKQQKEQLHNYDRSMLKKATYITHLDETTQVNEPYFLRSMPRLLGDVQPAANGQLQARQVSHSERKQRTRMEKSYRQARVAEKAALDAERNGTVSLNRLSRGGRMGEARNVFVKEEYESEKAILDKWLTAIDEQEKADLAAVKLYATQTNENIDAQKAEVRYKAYEEREAAYHRMAAQLPLGSKQRKAILEKAEKAVVEAGYWRKKYKVANMPAGPEKDRESDTISRHAGFDFLKKFFRKPTPYSREDAVATVNMNGQAKNLMNVGRATLGGTKAMYIFEDETTREQWLFKEATNCIGNYKPEGALVTEAASELQRALRGPLHIPAHCLRDENGKICGSIQKRIKKAEGGIDLFRWQADIHQADLPAVTRNDLLNEHVLDWLLCNFDTKGENFINQEGGHIISFDKEASFNSLLKDEAQHMSYTFKPHSNDTIYNTIFRAYARGEIDLDLNAVHHSIQMVENMDTDMFVNMFEESLRIKFDKSYNKDFSKAKQLLRERKENLRQEYCNFFTALIQERAQNVANPSAIDQQLFDMVRNGGSFTFPAE